MASKSLSLVGLCLILSISWASVIHARTWTSNDGKTIDAEIVNLTDDKVILKFKGKEVTLPLSRLSEEDQDWAKDWAEEKEDNDEAGDNSGSSPGEISLCGTALKPGGSTTIVEEPLNEKTLKKYSKAKTTPSKIKIAIALPSGFDPKKPQKVMWVSAPINNEGQRKSGNIGSIRAFAGTATGSGWVTIAVDLDIGNPIRPDSDRAEGGDHAVHTQVIETLAKTWPGFNTWQFACCGGSGGAKVSFSRVGNILASDLNVIGLFLAGCNQDLTEEARKETRYKKSGLRKIKVWISNGKSDTISTVGHAESIYNSIKSNRYGKTRLELFDGGHSINRGEFKKALTWFSEPSS